MNSLFRIGTFTLAAALAAASFAAGSDQQQVRAAYAKLNKAMKARNLAAVEALEAPGFTETDDGRTLNQKQANSTMKMEFKSIKTFSFDLKVTGVKVSGKAAHATSTYTVHLSIAGQDKKQHALVFKGVSSDDLVKMSKGWLFKQVTETTQSATMDGKKVNPQTMQPG